MHPAPANSLPWSARPRVAAGAALLAGVLVVTACASSSGSGPARSNPAVHTGAHLPGAIQLVADGATLPTPSGAAVDQVVSAEQKLALALLRELGDGTNISVSPASLYVALAMLQNGAAGTTERQIADALQAGGLRTGEQNSGLAGLVAQLTAAAAKDGVTLDSANSIWQQRGVEVRKQFLTTLDGYFSAGVWQVDYAHDMAAAVRAINDWTARATHDKITKLFDQLDPSTALVLANAIYFHAAWATPFDKSRTQPGQFTCADGSVRTTKFMFGDAGLRAVAAGDYEAIELPYRGGRFAALAVMPTTASLGDFVASLTPAKLASIAASTRPGVTVALPRFTTTSKLDLVPALKALGMVDAFTDHADLSRLSDTAMTVDQIVQRVYLGVGEKGTTAAAATGIAIMPTSAPAGPEVALDHPFLFLVRDTVTGAVLFASEIQDPTAA